MREKDEVGAASVAHPHPSPQGGGRRCGTASDQPSAL